MSTDLQEKPRRLRNAVEPVAAGMYFAPEAHAAYTALGFEGGPVTQDGVARPDMKALRGSCRDQDKQDKHPCRRLELQHLGRSEGG